MNATCLINSYNYREYVGEAVRSALNQTHPFAKIVVVDDGSADDSVEFLDQQFKQDPRVLVVPKEHGGQLSCFNRGIREVTSDLVFFLDADDRYQPNYLESAIGVYRRDPAVEFLSVAPHPFGTVDEGRPRRRRRTRALGLSVLAAILGTHWVGERTSCLSMRTVIARKVLPYPHEEEWILRADDVLVLGSSLVGAYKYHFEEELVDYRIHARNHFVRKDFDSTAKMRHSLAINRLLQWYSRRMSYHAGSLPHHLHREFRTHDRPTFREWRAYQQLSWRARLPLSVRCRHFLAMATHFARKRYSPVTSLQQTEAVTYPLATEGTEYRSGAA